jgi:Zn-finger nucleic acid-binding protein
MTTKCPRDGEVLARFTYESNVVVDKCPRCSGIFLDKGELEAIQEIKERSYEEELKVIPDDVAAAYAIARQKQQGTANCPKCAREMFAKEYAYCSRILIDVCPTCAGVWLESGELKALEVFFERTTQPTGQARQGFFRRLFSKA